MAQKPQDYRTPKIAELFPELVRAGLAGDRSGVELVTSTAIRVLREPYPEIASALADLMASAATGSANVRWNSTEPPPADSDSGAALVRIITAERALEPVLPEPVASAVHQFIAERQATSKLLREGLLPPRSLLLMGAPGTGKTMLAHWIAAQLEVKLVVLDLASAMSSFLGKTGSNLRRSLDFARGQPCVFLLDEFDAIAKRRDDETEVGELKRIVNVLLKELEDWPVQSVLVAATNHPELLDPAISRRFDVVLELPKPEVGQREAILRLACVRFSELLPTGFLPAVAQVTDGLSGSALVTLAQTAVRRHVVAGFPLSQSIVAQVVEAMGGDVDHYGELVQALHETGDLSVRNTAALFGKSPSTIQYYLTKPKPRSASDANPAPKKTHPRER